MTVQGRSVPASDRLRGVIAALGDGIVVVDLANRMQFANRAACDLFGRTAASMVGTQFPLRLTSGEVDLVVAGSPHIVELRLSTGVWGREQVVVVQLRDLTTPVEDMVPGFEAPRPSLQDDLTGLPNRTLLLDRLHHALARTDRKHPTVTVLLVNLDDFRAVNEELGHDAGDDVLRTAARRLRSAVRPADTVGRPGGDEFMVLCEGLDGPVEAARMAERVVEALGARSRAGNRDVVVGASVGLSAAGSDTRAEDLLAEAGVALDAAKQAGKGCQRRFDEGLRATVAEDARLEERLRDAIHAGRLRIDYQPIFDLATGAVASAQALLRCDDPGENGLTAERFALAVESSGLMLRLGAWALRRACNDAARWRGEGRPLPVTVNLGTAQLCRSAAVAEVLGALKWTGLPPDDLWLDIGEEAAADSPRAVADLAGLGVRVGVGDWGKGSGSVVTLARLNPSYVKLDRSVVAALPGGGVTERALAGAARTLGLPLAAAGVTSAEQLTLARSLGCREAQGSHLGPAGPAAALFDGS
ncbi:MAG TPA: EAL domain-containing protein [Acidimicrobiales bacterium]|nr:EAL domain-containing protein [Acidimicrobiales bacterium]